LRLIRRFLGAFWRRRLRGKKTENFCLGVTPEGLYTGGESIDICGGGCEKRVRDRFVNFLFVKISQRFSYS
jgi:hypothetical protein